MKFDLQFKAWEKKCKDGKGKQLCALFSFGSYKMYLSYEELCEHLSRPDSETPMDKTELEKAEQAYPKSICIVNSFNKKGAKPDWQKARLLRDLGRNTHIFDGGDSWNIRTQKSLCPDADKIAAA